MVTLTIDAPGTVVAVPTAYTLFAGGSVLPGGASVATNWGMGPRDQLVIVEAITENRLAELRCASIDKPTWVLNGVGTMGFKVPVDDPTLLDCLVDPASVEAGAGELKLLGREAQFWRDGELRWAGPVVAASVNMSAGAVEFSCFDHGWYPSKRFVGDAERYDYLEGIGQMETAGLPGWTRTGVTMTRTSSTRARGTYSAQIIGEGAATASFVHPVITSGQDGTVLFTTMVKLSSAAAVGEPILSIRAVPAGSDDAYRPTDENWARITEDTVLGGWTRVTAFCHLKPNVANTVTVAEWSNSAVHSTYFDDSRVLRNDTIGIPHPGGDLTDHARALMNHLQRSTTIDGHAYDLGYGFTVVVFDNTGTVEPLGIRKVSHQAFLDLFDSYVNREDGWDWWVDPQRRRFCFAPRRGQDHTHAVIDSRTVLAGGWNHDETDVATAVVTVGDGEGPERPEGFAQDPTAYGGLRLEYLHRMPTDAALSTYDPTAAAVLAQRIQPQTTLKATLVPATWWEEFGVGPGDIFPDHLSAGVLRPSTSAAGFRVQQMAHDLEADLLELV